jgi:hypothetical protein
MSDRTASVGLNCVDIKISANSRSYNVDCHVYEGATKDRIDTVISNAIYAMRETQHRVQKEIVEESLKQ